VAGTLMVILSSIVAVLGSDKNASTQNFANFSNVIESAEREVLVLVVVVSGSGSRHIQKRIMVETETVLWK
jgi:hypothetical protein